MIKIGILGSGQFTMWGLLPTFKKLENCKVIALYGNDFEKTKKIANENKIEKVDYLPQIKVGRSFISGSFKFLADKLIKHLNGERIDFDYCTLQQAYENQKILEEIQNS